MRGACYIRAWALHGLADPVSSEAEKKAGRAGRDPLSRKDKRSMKKFILAILVIGSFIIFSVVYNFTNNATLPPALSTSASNRSSVSASSSASATDMTPGAGDTNSTPTSTSTGQYKDGTYTGNVADAQWGNVQVQVVIQNGAMANVTFLQYPNERNRSVMINQYADPQLVSEAIQAQSASVDMITGATDTSEAFIQSLTDALSQAQA